MPIQNHRVPTFLLFLVLFVIFSSCSFLGFNPLHRTPARAHKHPVFTLEDSLKGSIGPFRSCFDVTYYELTLDIDIPGHYLYGISAISFTLLSPSDTIQIDLRKSWQIDSITLGKHRLGYRRIYDAVFVGMPAGKAEQNTITVYYQGAPPKAKRPPWEGGFTWKKDKKGHAWIGVSCELIGSSTWWPSKDALYDEPDSMKINVTVPAGLMCVSNGRLKDSVSYQGKTLYTWATSYPINTYNATIYIGDFRHFSIPYRSITGKLMDLDFYVLPYNLGKAREHFKQAAEILSFYEKTFGPYPWPRDGYKLVESPFMGMEHQTAIAYGNYYKKSFMGWPFDYIILHETAHEWWGNSLTAASYADIWLHEGFATYSEALYVENLLSYRSYFHYLSTYAMMIKNRSPLIGPREVNYWNITDSDPYFKGAITLHILRSMMNDDSAFFRLLRKYYADYSYGIASTTDFIESVNAATGKDMGWFFNQYLYRREWPVLEYDSYYDRENETYVLCYRWANTSGDFSLPVNLFIDPLTVRLYVTTKVQRYELGKENKFFFDLISFPAMKKNRKLRSML